ncbi:hypothetical protein C8Q80DRAFT_1114011 [Daedaleopsis nitida]|nr:hypothetical protein C8Q80DRAFT_1114011 [Daedaleopsis nitida]
MATPPAPVLEGDARLEVFQHHSFPTTPREPYGDGRRLISLGRRHLGAAYADAIVRARLYLRGLQLQQHIDATFPGFVTRCVARYGWRDKMYAVPDGVDLEDPEETRRIFEAYAGAVVAQKDLGVDVLFKWIADLVNASG